MGDEEEDVSSYCTTLIKREDTGTEQGSTRSPCIELALEESMKFSLDRLHDND
jgi:hypothetical protein